jgi:hypothetical protein
MFSQFVEHGLTLPTSDFFKGMLRYYDIEYVNFNPNGVFCIFVFVHLFEAFVGINPHRIFFRKFFRLKPHPSANHLRVVRGAGVQMHEDAVGQYLTYKLIDSNQDWKAWWFYVSNHYPSLLKLSGYLPKHQ